MPDGRDMIFMSMSNGLLSFYATFFVTSWRHDVVIIVIGTELFTILWNIPSRGSNEWSSSSKSDPILLVKSEIATRKKWVCRASSFKVDHENNGTNTV